MPCNNTHSAAQRDGSPPTVPPSWAPARGAQLHIFSFPAMTHRDTKLCHSGRRHRLVSRGVRILGVGGLFHLALMSELQGWGRRMTGALCYKQVSRGLDQSSCCPPLSYSPRDPQRAPLETPNDRRALGLEEVLPLYYSAMLSHCCL